MQKLIYTTAGRGLKARLEAGETTASFTRMKTSAHDYSGVDIEALTSLEDVKQDVLISDVSVANEVIVKVFARIDNMLLEEGYFIRAIGIYAKDAEGNELLYGVSLADEIVDWMPAFNGTTPTGYSYTFNTEVSNSDAITIVIDPAAVPSPEQIDAINEEITELKKSVGDGKELVADAITEKGVTTAADAAFAEMANNIKRIDVELHGATISVTTEETALIGKSATLTKYDAVVATKTFGDNGACSFTDIQDPGDYTVSASDGTDSTSETVTITSDNIVNKTVLSFALSLIPDGSTVTPTDDVSIWLKCAGSKAGYTTTAEVLADSDTMFSLTSDENAMKYLERSTSFADDLCADETFMTYLGQSPYVDDTILNSDLWKQKIKASQYWSLVYTTVYTIHAGALETIAIDGVYGSFITNSDGTVNHALPLGELTLNGSISGQSFTRTVTKDTTDVYVMPEGFVLYWHGYLNPILYNKTVIRKEASYNWDTNYISLSYTSNNGVSQIAESFSVDSDLSYLESKTPKAILTQNGSFDSFGASIYFRGISNMANIIKSGTGYYMAQYTGKWDTRTYTETNVQIWYIGNGKIHAIWFE